VAAAPSSTRSAGGGAANRLFANLVALSLSQVTTWTLTLIWTVVVPRLLGPAGSGFLVLVWSVNGLLMALCGMGSRTMLIREIARDRARAPGLLATALAVRAAACLPCIGFTVLYIHLARYASSERAFLYVAAVLTAFMLLSEPMQAAFQGIERMKYQAYSDILNKGVAAVLGIALVMVGFRANALAWLMVVAAAVVLVADWIWIRRYVNIAWGECLRGLRAFIRQSMAYWAYAISYTFYLWIDASLVGILAPPAVLGYYGMPTKLFGTILFLPTILATAWLPRLSASFREGGRRQLRKMSRAPLELSVVLSLPIATGVVLVAQPMVMLLYGKWFEPSVPVIQILAWAAIPMYLNIIVATVLIAAGRQTVWTVVLGAAGIFNMGANLILIPYYQNQMHNGAIGAAIALVVTEVLVAVTGVIVGRRFLTWRVMPRIVRSLLATAGMAASVIFLRRYGLIAEVGGGGIVFAGLALLLRVPTKEEQREAMSMIRRVLSGRRLSAGDAQTMAAGE
jgi:O-antigen/teichoic acid export membrane protein